MTVTIAVETPLQDDVREMVVALNGFLTPLTPPQFQYQLTVEQMAEPGVALFVARERDNAVGMGALKDHGDGIGEIKRMWTDPAARGRRIGAALLTRIEDHARQKGISHLVLETGEVIDMVASWHLYERGGFKQCGPVLDYPPSDYTRFYEKKLS